MLARVGGRLETAWLGVKEIKGGVGGGKEYTGI